MNGIGWAVKQMQDGQRVARQGWNGKGMWLALVRGCKRRTPEGDVQVPQSEFWGLGPHILATHGQVDDVPVQPFVVMFTATGALVPWLCSQSDLLATDWIQVP